MAPPRGSAITPSATRLSRSLTLFLGKVTGRSLPGELMLAASLHELARDLLGVAEVDLGSGRSRRAERETGELQLGRGLRRALADQVHGRFAHGLVGLLGKHFETVGDRRHRD